jgi:plasmid maintenance system killer protein
MEIFIGDGNLRSALEDDDACRRRFGADMAKKIKLRIAALRAADSLADFWPPKSGPERCHELKGNRTGTFSIDVKQPYRLLFKPAEELPELDPPDEQQRWQLITGVELLGIEDTHG